MEYRDRLAESINVEPVAFLDCTLPQIMLCAVCGFFVGLFFALLFSVLLSFIIGIILGIMIMMLTTYYLMVKVGGLREDKYPGWLEEKIFMTKLSLGLKDSVFVDYSNRYGRGHRRGR